MTMSTRFPKHARHVKRPPFGPPGDAVPSQRSSKPGYDFLGQPQVVMTPGFNIADYIWKYLQKVKK
jgi:hypothetical protein